MLCAVAVAGAIRMVLELEKGFGGVIHVSPQPMRQAVAQLQYSDRMDPHLPGGQVESHSESHPNSGNRLVGEDPR